MIASDFEFLSRPSYGKKLKRKLGRVFTFRIVESIFPPLKWIPVYDWRKDLASDAMAGLITGIMLVPQGIAYAFLAGVDPINGLYSSFFSPFLYFLFGLSPHVARGPSSVLGVMSQISNQAIRAEVLESGVEIYLSASTIASTLTFTCGIIQILMGIVRFKFLADYFSDALISGFVCGAAIHTVISQLSKLFGVKTQPHSGYFSAFFNLYELALKYNEYKLQTILLSGCSLTFLMIGKLFLVPWIRRKYHFVLPVELLLIIFTTSLSYFFCWNDSMSIVGSIPSGFPKPQLPVFWLIPHCLPHALAICSVTVALHFSMTKLFANKFHYSVSLSHELYAIGFGTMISGCFPTYPTSTALARTVVLVESGARTLLASGFSAVLVLIVILCVGPLFETLPQCVLSAIIIVSLKTVFGNFKSVRSLWKADKFDFVIWCLSFIGTLFTNVIIGLGVGVLTSLFTLIVRIQWPRWSFKIPGDSRFCIFCFESPLLFANCEHFSESIRKTLHNWHAVRIQNTEKPNPDLVFVLNCAAMSRLDTMGLQTLRQCVQIVEESGVRVQFINVNAHVLKFLASAELDTHIVDVCTSDLLVHNQHLN
ncbi:hypothetical protein M3Y97_00365100 [Aphelenchoides bicaudatus]|nr:hypothetical protein M3Y97_00365100 [Aphelenchoides bicaudatus]